MTHEPETDFEHDVLDWLEATFPEAGIEIRPRLDSYRIPDFVVTFETPGESPNVVITIEVENDFEAITDGIGQATMYAGHFEWGIPAVAIPGNHREEPEFGYIERETNVLLLEIPQ